MISCLQLISLCRLLNHNFPDNLLKILIIYLPMNSIMILFQNDYIDQHVQSLMSTSKPPRKKCKTRGGSAYRSSTIVSPIVNVTQSSFSPPPLSQNDQTEPLLDSDAMNINNINKDNFHIPSPDASTSRQIAHKFNNNKNNPNIAEHNYYHPPQWLLREHITTIFFANASICRSTVIFSIY